MRPRRAAGGKTLLGVAIRHTGILRLERADGGIRLDVTLSSPGCRAGRHAVAGLLGANPKQQLDRDLLPMKTLLETGSPPTTPL